MVMGISETFASFAHLWIWVLGSKHQGPHPQRCHQALRSQSAECQVGRSGQGKFGRRSDLDNAHFISLHWQEDNPDIRTCIICHNFPGHAVEGDLYNHVTIKNR